LPTFVLFVQDTHERQQIHAAKAAQQTDMHIVELKAELKQRAFELSHLKVRQATPRFRMSRQASPCPCSAQRQRSLCTSA